MNKAILKYFPTLHCIILCILLQNIAYVLCILSTPWNYQYEYIITFKTIQCMPVIDHKYEQTNCMYIQDLNLMTHQNKMICFPLSMLYLWSSQ